MNQRSVALREINHIGPSTAPPIVHEVLRSPGKPLNQETLADMEARFDYDFSRVRVHADAKSAESAQAINARAYTVGQDVVFGAGEYVPGTSVGQRLLAHELAHVVQHLRAGAKSDVEQRAETSVAIQRSPDPPEQSTGGGGCLPQENISDFCQPYGSRAEARQVRTCWLNSYVPLLSSLFGSEVGSLWRSYLGRRHGASLARQVFSSPSSQIVQGFVASSTTNQSQRTLANSIKSSIRSSCPNLPANRWTEFPVDQFLPQSELNYPINFDRFTEIPGHIAGGAGSSAAGPDSRSVSGTVWLYRSTNRLGITTGIDLSTNFRFTVRDAIDFCPGEPGNESEQALTIPLSRLEATGLLLQDEPFAYDVPYEVRFTGTPIEEALAFSGVRACYPNAVHPGTEITTAPPESDSSEPDDRRPEDIFMRRKPMYDSPYAVSPLGQVDGIRSGGQPISHTVRDSFESRVGYDFSHVRVHLDAKAAESARNMSARAYTVGRDIVFGAGEHRPETACGRRLLGHELAHIVQQWSVSLRQFPTKVRQPDRQCEQATESAKRIVGIRPTGLYLGSRTSSSLLQRHVTHSSEGRIGGPSEFLGGFPEGGTEGRYLFTLRGGWLDRSHVQPHIEQANQVMADLERRRAPIPVTTGEFSTSYNMDYRRIPAPVDQDKLEQVALAIMTDHDYLFEAYQTRRLRDVAAQTPFSYEDLPSDRVGVEIGLRYRRQARAEGLNPDQGLSTASSPQARLLQRVTRQVVQELQPGSAWQGIELYRGFLQTQGSDVQPEFGPVPQGAPPGVIRPPMLPGLRWARSFFQGISQLRQLVADYSSIHPRHLFTSPYIDPTLSPVTNPARFLVDQPPNWAWQTAGLDRDVITRAIRALHSRPSAL